MNIIELLRQYMLETDDELEKAIYQTTIIALLEEEE